MLDWQGRAVLNLPTVQIATYGNPQGTRWDPAGNLPEPFAVCWPTFRRVTANNTGELILLKVSFEEI